MLRTLTQEKKSVAIHFAYTMFANHSPPLLAVTANSGVEVAKQNELVRSRRIAQKNVLVSVELLFP